MVTTNQMVIDLHGKLQEISHGAIKITITRDKGKGLIQIPGATIETKGGTALATMTTRIRSIETGVTTMTATVVTHRTALVIIIVNMIIATTIETTETTSHTLSVR